MKNQKPLVLIIAGTKLAYHELISEYYSGSKDFEYKMIQNKEDAAGIHFEKIETTYDWFLVRDRFELLEWLKRRVR